MTGPEHHPAVESHLDLELERELEDLRAKVKRVESMAGWWGACDDRDLIAYTAAGLAIHTTLNGPPNGGDAA